MPTYDEIVDDEADVSEEEELLVRQDNFERKFNFRFEEPDALEVQEHLIILSLLRNIFLFVWKVALMVKHCFNDSFLTYICFIWITVKWS